MMILMSSCVPPVENQPSPNPSFPSATPHIIGTEVFSTNTPSVNNLQTPTTPIPSPIIHSVISITTPEEAIAEIKALFSMVANIVTAEPQVIGASQDIYILPRAGGWDIVFWEGTGDCMAGCLNNHYWYYKVEKIGQISQVGEFERVYNVSSNDFILRGMPLWGIPN